ncbi:MAG TPA: sulfurtransferase [Rugosibacter sp.]
MNIVTISCYKFITLENREMLQADLTARCLELHLKGTILLAPEGINVFLAGSREAIDAMVAYLRSDVRFSDLQPKESMTSLPPFGKLRVRLKKEIITMKHSLIRPEADRAPSVTGATLKTWLDRGHDDAGRPIVMLDTRNDYEVAAGSFTGAIDYQLATFSEFPAQITAQKTAHKNPFDGKTVVTFCTGGIRCEKAAIYMQEVGIKNVLQLEGGILKYLEDVGDAHYQGGCFVFDNRRVLDADLQPATCEEIACDNAPP